MFGKSYKYPYNTDKSKREEWKDRYDKRFSAVACTFYFFQRCTIGEVWGCKKIKARQWSDNHYLVFDDKTREYRECYNGKIEDFHDFNAHSHLECQWMVLEVGE